MIAVSELVVTVLHVILISQKHRIFNPRQGQRIIVIEYTRGPVRLCQKLDPLIIHIMQDLSRDRSPAANLRNSRSKPWSKDMAS